MVNSKLNKLLSKVSQIRGWQITYNLGLPYQGLVCGPNLATYLFTNGVWLLSCYDRGFFCCCFLLLLFVLFWFCEIVWPRKVKIFTIWTCIKNIFWSLPWQSLDDLHFLMTLKICGPKLFVLFLFWILFLILLWFCHGENVLFHFYVHIFICIFLIILYVVLCPLY